MEGKCENRNSQERWQTPWKRQIPGKKTAVSWLGLSEKKGGNVVWAPSANRKLSSASVVSEIKMAAVIVLGLLWDAGRETRGFGHGAAFLAIRAFSGNVWPGPVMHSLTCFLSLNASSMT